MRASVEAKWGVGSPQRWKQDAACVEYPYFWWEAESGPEAQMAKSICWTQCPVRRMCFEAAMAAERRDRDWFRQGIWGGVSAHMRRMIAKGQASYPRSMPQDRRYERMRTKKGADRG